MPELPEVETVRQVLGPQLQGRRILAVLAAQPQVVAQPACAQFCRLLEGRQFAGMARRGKFLSLLLAGGGEVVVHLRMTGSLLLTPPGWPLEKHTHLIFQLDDGRELRFTDPRRFGRLWLLLPGDPDTTGRARLGPEPFSEEWNPAYLRQVLARRKRPLKECLLDQSIVAGIGNIYADEILFAARLSPLRPANTLNEAELERLVRQVPQTLQGGIEQDRMTAEEYLAGNGRGYRSSPFFLVYGHDGLPCPVCGTPLCRAVLSGRSSVYCPCCQNEAPAGL